MAQVVRLPTFTQTSWVEFWASGFSVFQIQVLWALGCESVNVQSVFQSLPAFPKNKFNKINLENWGWCHRATGEVIAYIPTRAPIEVLLLHFQHRSLLIYLGKQQKEPISWGPSKPSGGPSWSAWLLALPGLNVSQLQPLQLFMG